MFAMLQKFVMFFLLNKCTNCPLCLQEFAEDRAQFLPPWVVYFSACDERDRLLAELSQAWAAVYQARKHFFFMTSVV